MKTPLFFHPVPLFFLKYGDGRNKSDDMTRWDRIYLVCFRRFSCFSCEPVTGVSCNASKFNHVADARSRGSSGLLSYNKENKDSTTAEAVY